jgi:hypothetical protein
METKLFKVLMLVLLLVVSAAVAHARQDPQTVDSLIQDLTSSNTEVAGTAALKLVEMREAALPKLFAFIRDQNDKAVALYKKAGALHQQAMDALVQAEGARSTAAQGFMREAEEPSKEAHQHDKNSLVAFLIVGKIGGPAVDSLLDYLKNEFPLTRLRRDVAEQLAIIGDKRAIGPLVATLGDGGSVKTQREATMDALNKITGQDFGHDEGKWEAWWETTGSAKGSRKPPTSVNRIAEITDYSRYAYPNMNRGDDIRWPSAEMKKLGGEDGWGSFRPKNGDQGTVVAEASFDRMGRRLYILKIGNYYVVISSGGVKLH